jgi:hypothetical protein
LLNNKLFLSLLKPALIIGCWFSCFLIQAQNVYQFKRFQREANSVEFNLNVRELNSQNLFIAYASRSASENFWKIEVLNYSIELDSTVKRLIIGNDSSNPTLGYYSTSSILNNRAVLGFGSTSKLPYSNRNPTLLAIDLSSFEVEFFHQELRDSFNYYGQTKLLNTGIYALGYDKLTHQDGDFLLSKHKVNGDLLWSKTLGSNYYDVGVSVIETTNGQLYLLGESRGYGPVKGFYTDALLIKTDSLGNELWRTTWGGYFNDCANNLAATPDGGVIACGCISEEFSNGNSNVAQGYVRKMDAEGNLIWEKTYDWQSALVGGSAHTFNVVRVLDNENIMVVGSGAKLNVDTTGSRTTPWAVIFDKNGNVLMERAYTSLAGDYSSAEFQDIQPTADGGFIAGGTYYPSQGDTGNQDAFIVKLDERGCEFADCQPPLAVNELSDVGYQLSVWPNPASGLINIETDSPIESIAVFNQLGNETLFMDTERSRSDQRVNQQIDISSFKPGLYFLVVKTAKGVETKKVIKQD